MAFKFNPFTGNFDDVADVAEKLESSTGSSTDNAIVRYDGTSALLVQDSSVLIDDSDNVSGLVNLTLSGNIDVNAAQALTIGATVGANNFTLGASSSTVVIPGNLQVDGTTTSVNSATLDVADSNISVNVGGNQASADSNDAGLTVEMTDATDAIVFYDSTSTTNWKIGLVGSSFDVVDDQTAQTLRNKTIANTSIINVLDTNFAIQDDADDTKQIAFNAQDITTGTTRTLASPNASGTLVLEDNTATLSNKTLAAPVIATILNSGTLTLPTATDTLVARNTTDTLTNKTIVVSNNTINTAASGNLTATELNAALAELQTDIDTRTVITDIFSIQNNSGAFTATANETYIVDTSGGVATVTLPAASTSTFVRIKDNGNSESNNITIQTPGAETIDGAATFVINSNYGSANLVSDGTNWFIL